MNKKIIIGVGAVGIAVAIAYYFYNKNKTAAALPSGSGAQSLPGIAPGVSPLPSSPAPTARQTLWKDRDGNIFELTSIKQRWGYVIKVNGSVQGKMNQMELMLLGPDGYMIGADNNGSVYVYKNGGWQYVVRDNKTAAKEYLAKYGVTDVSFLNGLALGAYLLS